MKWIGNRIIHLLRKDCDVDIKQNVRMIISHKNKFVFIKTRKTAGTSIEIELSAFCGEDDAITPISPEDEVIRHEKYGKLPQNFTKKKDYESEYAQAVRSRNIERIRNTFKIIHENDKSECLYNHIPFKEAAKIDSRIKNKEYLKITSERDPIDRLISRHYWSNKNKEKLSRLSLLRSAIRLPRTKRFHNFRLYSVNGESVADYVIRYEYLIDDFEQLCRILGQEPPGDFAKTKHETRKDRRNGRDILTVIEREWVKYCCHREIEILEQENAKRRCTP